MHNNSFQAFPITVYTTLPHIHCVYNESTQKWEKYVNHRRCSGFNNIWMLQKELGKVGAVLCIPPDTPHVVFPKESDIQNIFEYYHMMRTVKLVGGDPYTVKCPVDNWEMLNLLNKYPVETLRKLGGVYSEESLELISNSFPASLLSLPWRSAFKYGTLDYPDQFS